MSRTGRNGGGAWLARAAAGVHLNNEPTRLTVVEGRRSKPLSSRYRRYTGAPFFVGVCIRRTVRVTCHLPSAVHVLTRLPLRASPLGGVDYGGFSAPRNDLAAVRHRFNKALPSPAPSPAWTKKEDQVRNLSEGANPNTTVHTLAHSLAHT